MSIRVRYAPSPTGYQHIGGARTALFNYLFARSQGGVFVLRIEDTDRQRLREDALEDIFRTFDWLGFHWDEGPDVGGDFGPYIQSQRKALYEEHVDILLRKGAAYRCYCSPERLEKLRLEQREKKLPIGYDRHCRNLSDSEKEKNSRLPFVVRLKVPLEGKTVFRDELLGEIAKANRDISPDPVLLKSDGFPTYHLANVVDDHRMEISHILRGPEWLSSVPIHVILYDAFGWTPPPYYHLPMVLGEDGKKLSKRHGAQTVQDFKASGYLPEAFVNHIALLGWSFDDSRELFSLEEMIRVFSLERINTAPAVFDYKKLLWFNGVYIREKPEEELQRLIEPLLIRAGLLPEEPSEEQKALLLDAVPLIRERLRLLNDAPDMLAYLFREPEDYDPQLLIPKKLDRRKTLDVLEALLPFLEEFAAKDDEANEADLRRLASRLGVKLGDLLMPLRVALTGSKVSPPLLGSMRLLGEERTRERVARAIEMLAS